MWTSSIELSPERIFLTQLLGRFWRGAYFSSFAPLQVKNVPRQTLPASGWVRVRNRLAGICGSDLHLIYADGDLRVAPAALPAHNTMYLGHEVVGEILEKGDDVQSLTIGDRVVLQNGPNCLSSNIQPLCRSCASGFYNLCERGKLPEPYPIGGGWSEEMLVHEQQLFRVPAALTDEQAVLLEPTSVALHAVLRYPPQDADRILIIGAGTIGLLTLQAIKALAPQAEVSVLARHSFQVEQATRMGAAHIIYPKDSYEGVQRATEGTLYRGLLGNTMMLGGYDIVYDTVGTRHTLHDSLRWVRAKGSIILIGVNLHLMHIDLTPIWYQEINLLGTMGQGMEQWPLGSEQQCSTFSIAAEMIAQGQLQPEKLISHRFALDNYKHALRTATDKGESRATKVVFDYSLQPATVVPNVRASALQRRNPAKNRLTRPLDTRPLTPHEKTAPIPEPVAELDEDTLHAVPIIQTSLTSEHSSGGRDDSPFGAPNTELSQPATYVKEPIFDLRTTSMLAALPEGLDEQPKKTIPITPVYNSVPDMPTVSLSTNNTPRVFELEEDEENDTVVHHHMSVDAAFAQGVPENVVDLAQLEQLLEEMPINPVDFDFGAPITLEPSSHSEHMLSNNLGGTQDDSSVGPLDTEVPLTDVQTLGTDEYIVVQPSNAIEAQEDDTSSESRLDQELSASPILEVEPKQEEPPVPMLEEDEDMLALGPIQEALAELAANEEAPTADDETEAMNEESHVDTVLTQPLSATPNEEEGKIERHETKQTNQTLLGVGSSGGTRGENFSRRVRGRKKTR